MRRQQLQALRDRVSGGAVGAWALPPTATAAATAVPPTASTPASATGGGDENAHPYTSPHPNVGPLGPAPAPAARALNTPTLADVKAQFAARRAAQAARLWELLLQVLPLLLQPLSKPLSTPLPEPLSIREDVLAGESIVVHCLALLASVAIATAPLTSPPRSACVRRIHVSTRQRPRR